MKNIKDNQSLKDELLINGKKVTEKLRTGKGFRTSISAYDDYGNVLFKGVKIKQFLVVHYLQH